MLAWYCVPEILFNAVKSCFADCEKKSLLQCLSQENLNRTGIRREGSRQSEYTLETSQIPTYCIHEFISIRISGWYGGVYRKKKKLCKKVTKQGRRWINTRNFDFETLYGGHFAVSTRLITLNDLIFTLIFDIVFYFPLHIFLFSLSLMVIF